MPGLGRLEHPASVGGDADRHHVVLLRVERRDHAARPRCRRWSARWTDHRRRRRCGACGHRPRLLSEGLLTRRPYRRSPARTGRTRAGPYAGDMRPATQAVHLGRPPHEPDQPLNTPDHDGLDVRRGRRPRVRPLRQPDLDRVRGGARRPRGRALPGLRQRAGRGRDDPRPRRQRAEGGRAAARLQRLDDAAGRPRGAASGIKPTSSTSPTPTPSWRPARTPRWSGSRPRPTLRWRSPTCPTITKAAHEAGAYVVVDNTFATPVLQQPLDWDVDLVVHSATKYIAGHSDLVMGAHRDPRRRAVRRTQGTAGPDRRHPERVRRLAGAARPAHAATADGARAGQRPGARTPPPGARRPRGGPLPRLSAR